MVPPLSALGVAACDLSPKTRANALGAFRSFLGWLHRREELRRVPQFPWPKVEEPQPRLLSIEDQDAILAAIPDAVHRSH